jgi:hypothetical protein
MYETNTSLECCYDLMLLFCCLLNKNTSNLQRVLHVHSGQITTCYLELLNSCCIISLLLSLICLRCIFLVAWYFELAVHCFPAICSWCWLLSNWNSHIRSYLAAGLNVYCRRAGSNCTQRWLLIAEINMQQNAFIQKKRMD